MADKALDRWLSVLYPPRPGIIQSEGPGTGPAQQDSGKFLGADRQSNAGSMPRKRNPAGVPNPGIPDTDTPDAGGYGGGADVTYVVAPPKSTAFDANTILRARASDKAAARFAPPPPAIPRFNSLYSPHLTTDDLGDTRDIFASGTITPTATSASVTVSVAQTIVGGFLAPLMRFPGAIQMFLIVSGFSASPSGTTQTGALSWTFADQFGSQPIALCTSTGAATATGVNLPANCTNSTTDPGLNNGTLGTLTATQTGALGTAVAWAWNMNFSLGLLLPTPAFKAYLPEYDELRQSIHTSSGELARRGA